MSSYQISPQQKKLLIAGKDRVALARGVTEKLRVKRLADRHPALVKRVEFLPDGVRYRTTKEGIDLLRWYS